MAGCYLGKAGFLRASVAVLAAFAMSSAFAAAVSTAAPLNDDFSDRLPMQLGVADTRTNVGAGVEAGERLTANDPDGFGCSKQGAATADGIQMNGTLWWEFTGNGGPITVSTLASNFDTVLAVYEVGGELVSCNDDIQPADPTRPTLQHRLASEVLIDSVAGTHYAVQVGGCIPPEKCGVTPSGNVTLRVSEPPPNDDRAAALPVGAGAPLTLSNTGATVASGERMLCEEDLYGKTVWFRYTAPAVGTAAFSAAGFDTVLAVYRGSSTVPLGCNDDAVEKQFGGSRFPMSQPPGPPLIVTPGDYLIQVGGFFDTGFSPVAARNGPLDVQVEFIPDKDLDDDGVSAERDCDETNAVIRPGVPEILNNDVDENCDGFKAFDLDGDGALAPPLGADCRDDDRGVNPGAVEIRGNRVDENCDSRTPDFRPLPTRIGLDWKVFRGDDPHTFVTVFSLSNVPAGVRVGIRCLGQGCPFSIRRYKVKQGRGLLKLPAGFRLEAGDLLDVRVTKPESIGREQSFLMRRNREPSSRGHCLDPSGHRRQC